MRTNSHPVDCKCCSRPTPAAQTLDEMSYLRSACHASKIGDVDRLASLIARDRSVLHSDGTEEGPSLIGESSSLLCSTPEDLSWVFQNLHSKASIPNISLLTNGSSHVNKRAAVQMHDLLVANDLLRKNAKNESCKSQTQPAKDVETHLS